MTTPLKIAVTFESQAREILARRLLWDAIERRMGRPHHPFPNEQIARQALSIMHREEWPDHERMGILHAPASPACRIAIIVIQKPIECEERVIAKLGQDLDSQALALLIRIRRDVGRAKYRKTMDRDDLALNAWLLHALEEQLDATLYFERAMDTETCPIARGNWRDAQTSALAFARLLQKRLRELSAEVPGSGFSVPSSAD